MGGLSCTTSEQALACDVGYVLLMRYLPNDGLYLDSKKPDFSRYHEFLDNEVRYSALKKKDENLARELLSINQENARKRYEYYVSIAKEKKE